MSGERLEEALIALAASYRARQEDHARKAGHTGQHAERAALLDSVVVDLERILCGEEPQPEDQHAARRLIAGIRKVRGGSPDA